MYKVFIYDKPVLIHKNSTKEGSYEQLSELGNSNTIISLLERKDIRGVEIVTNNPLKEWEIFKSSFKYIIAAGGVVYNSNDEILVIFRNGKWDLPKGKLEKGEDIPTCAIREVEEECGVSDLEITKELPSTYHCYQSKKGNWILKRTYWYKMMCQYSGELIAQTEEGIEIVEWFQKERYPEIKSNTYNSIKLVVDYIT